MGKWFRQILQGEHSLFRLSLPFRVRLFNVLALVGGMISLINGISSYANNQDSVILGLNFGIAVLSFVLLFYAYKSGRYQFCYVVTIITIFLVMFPYLFFKSGGYKGGMVSFIFLESYLQSLCWKERQCFLQHLRKWSYI